MFPNSSSSFVYDINSFRITARHLRIHIKNVIDPNLLTYKTTGFQINDIIGIVESTDEQLERVGVQPLTIFF